MRLSPGRIISLTVLARPQACAFPDGRCTGGYKITSDLLDVLGRNGMIQQSNLTAKSRKKHRIVFVYTITDKGRAWLASAQGA